MMLTPTQWNSNVLRSRGSFLQSFEWGAAQETFGRKIHRVQTDMLLGQVIEYHLPLGWRYLYVPRGPVGNWGEEQLQEWFNETKKIPATFLRIDPPREMIQVSSFRFHDVGHSLQPRQDRIIAINDEDEALLAAMHEKTRYNIRLALKHGVEIRNPKSEIRNNTKAQNPNVEMFWKLLSDTAKRQNIRLHSKKYYETILQVVPPLEEKRQESALQHRLYTVEHDGMTLAAALVVYFGDRATYIHGGSSEEKRSLMAPHALHWQIMREARELGYTEYDLGGIDEQRWPGLTRFKNGFGGFVEEFPNMYELPLNRSRYLLYRLARSIKR